RNAALIGYYEIPITPGTYTVQFEGIRADFTGGSSVGPLDPPVPYFATEYWHHYETAFDDPTLADPITVSAGQTVSNINIMVNGTLPRFDGFEDGQVRLERSTRPGLFRKQEPDRKSTRLN